MAGIIEEVIRRFGEIPVAFLPPRPMAEAEAAHDVDLTKIITKPELYDGIRDALILR